MEYEKLTGKLQEIISKLESDKITLNESISLFEEGVKLSKECFESLKSFQGKITQIKKDLDNSEAPFAVLED